jgi:hypothetical protein
MDAAERVRNALSEQAAHCRRMGSEFTARLCETIPATLDRNNAAGRRILEWDGDPAPLADNVPLRVAGALHFLARSRRVPELAAAYPPHPTPPVEQLSDAIRTAFESEPKTIERYLDSPPQTNEVGRSAVLLAGWLEVAARTQLPLSLYEIGSSAGLNLIADRYRYRFGSVDWGDPAAQPRLNPDWTGPAPAVGAPLTIASRRGCDRSPFDLGADLERERLLSYVWADQAARLARLAAAIAEARKNPPALDRADAAQWLREQLRESAQAGTARVLFHSIVWQYLPAETQRAITTHMAKLGTAARSETPLAWLRYELSGVESGAELRLTLWPGGEDRLLAVAHAHGNWIRWNG